MLLVVCNLTTIFPFQVFSNGKKPYQQLFTDVCQDLTAQLDTLNLLIKPLQVLAPKFDFEV